MKDQDKMSPALARVFMVLPAAFLGALLISYADDSRKQYWLTRDAVTATATITAEHSKGVVDYKYAVDGREFAGSGHRNWKQEKYRNVHPGDESILYYSSSHPAISSLEPPEFPPSGLPVMIVAGAMGFFVVATIINPRGTFSMLNDAVRRKLSRP
jgi:hypothetical protein